MNEGPDFQNVSAECWVAKGEASQVDFVLLTRAMRQPSSPVPGPIEAGSGKGLALCSSYRNIPSIVLGVISFPIVVTMAMGKVEPRRRRVLQPQNQTVLSAYLAAGSNALR